MPELTQNAQSDSVFVRVAVVAGAALFRLYDATNPRLRRLLRPRRKIRYGVYVVWERLVHVVTYHLLAAEYTLRSPGRPDTLYDTREAPSAISRA